jgi:hypothetical protein
VGTLEGAKLFRRGEAAGAGGYVCVWGGGRAGWLWFRGGIGIGACVWCRWIEMMIR